MTSGGLSRDFNSRLGEVSSAFDKKVEVLGEKMADISDQFEEMGKSSLNLLPCFLMGSIY
jgi:hypothetical protein